MKVLHIQLTGPYTPKFSYQENLLTKAQKQLGMDVYLLTNEEMWEKSKIVLSKDHEFVNEDDIPVTRLPYLKWIPVKINKKLRIYPNVYEKIKNITPDIIFVHDVQFLSILQVAKYAQMHPKVKVFVDGHADFMNSARGFISKNILHRLIYRFCAQKILPYTTRFWGTLPARVDFVHDVYDIPKEKIDFLPMGADDDMIAKYSSVQERHVVKESFGFTDEDLVIVTGGKIDIAKIKILSLMEAVNKIENDHIKLLVFGSVDSKLKEKFDVLCSDKVKYAGWANVDDAYKYFSIADLVIFPCLHSVYWEQVAGMGIPMVVKYMRGITHVDRGGNVKFLQEESVDEIRKTIEDIFLKGQLKHMKDAAERNKKFFSYRDIATRCIE